MDSTQTEIQEDDEPLHFLLRELQSINMLHRYIIVCNIFCFGQVLVVGKI
jgi:hypothetical protein